MIVACLDLEGVLVPEIWIAFAEKTGIKKLRLTTRDIPDYNKLMQGRLDILNENNLTLSDIQEVIKDISPFPGAKEFLNYAHSKGVTIFYITNRVVELKEATQQNLTKLGIPWDQTKETILMRGENNWGSDKSLRRALVGKDYRVMLLVGDNLGDFVEAKDNNLSPEKRKEIVEGYADYWGVKWFMLQNITYGDWEGALYDFNYSLSPDEVHNTRLNSLEPIR